MVENILCLERSESWGFRPFRAWGKTGGYPERCSGLAHFAPLGRRKERGTGGGRGKLEEKGGNWRREGATGGGRGELEEVSNFSFIL